MHDIYSPEATQEQSIDKKKKKAQRLSSEMLLRTLGEEKGLTTGRGTRDLDEAKVQISAGKDRSNAKRCAGSLKMKVEKQLLQSTMYPW